VQSPCKFCTTTATVVALARGRASLPLQSLLEQTDEVGGVAQPELEDRGG